MLLNLDYEQINFPSIEGATIEIKPLDVQTFQKIIPIIKETNSSDNVQEVGLTQMSSPKMIKLINDTLPRFTRNLQGVQVKKNNEVSEASIQDLMQVGSMLPNLFALLMKLVTFSQLTEEQEKKVENQ